MATQNKITGVVKKFNENRGFGFIIPDNGGKDIFAHVSKVQGKSMLYEGDKVRFCVEDTDKGLQATSIEIIKRVASAA